MMTIAAIRDNLAGAWSVMNGQISGLQLLDCTIEGFWRSFGAILLVFPMALVAMRSEYILVQVAGNEAPVISAFLTLRVVALILDWIAFPIIFLLLCRPLGIAANYVPFIITRNWASVLMAFFMVTPDLFFVLGFLPPGLLVIFQLGLICLMIWFSYKIARTILAVSPALAIPIVMLELLLSLVVAAGLSRLV